MNTTKKNAPEAVVDPPRVAPTCKRCGEVHLEHEDSVMCEKFGEKRGYNDIEGCM